MKARVLVCSVLALGVVALVAGISYSEDGPCPSPNPPGGAKAPAAEDGPVTSAPEGKNKTPHQLLGVLAGRWKVDARVWTDGEKPVVSEDRALNTWFFDGKFLRLRYTGTFNGQDYQAAGFMGYCLEAREFQLVWLSNQNCSIYHMSGQANEEGTKIEFKFVHQSAKGKFPCRIVYTIIDPNNYMVESWMDCSDKESQGEQLVFTRIGAPEAKDPHPEPAPDR